MPRVTGKLFKKYPERTFQGKNGTGLSRDFAIEFMDGNYMNYFLLVASNDVAEKLDNFRLGDTLDVSYVVNGRLGTGQYEGKIFMNLKALTVQLGVSRDDHSQDPDDLPTGNDQFEDQTMPDVPENNDLPF